MVSSIDWEKLEDEVDNALNIGLLKYLLAFLLFFYSPPIKKLVYFIKKKFFDYSISKSYQIDFKYKTTEEYKYIQKVAEIRRSFYQILYPVTIIVASAGASYFWIDKITGGAIFLAGCLSIIGVNQRFNRCHEIVLWAERKIESDFRQNQNPPQATTNTSPQAQENTPTNTPARSGNIAQIELTGLVILALIISISLIIIFSQPIDGLIKKSSITEIIALITAIILAIGTLIYIGFNTALTRNYRFIIVHFGYKNQISLFGGLIVFGIVLIFNMIYYRLSIVVVLAFVFLLLDLLILVFIGVKIGTNSVKSIKNQKVTLKMVVRDVSGNTQLKIIHNLELYQTTDNDYRFKCINGNEIIIPISQVQEIVSP